MAGTIDPHHRRKTSGVDNDIVIRSWRLHQETGRFGTGIGQRFNREGDMRIDSSPHNFRSRLFIKFFC